MHMQIIEFFRAFVPLFRIIFLVELSLATNHHHPDQNSPQQIGGTILCRNDAIRKGLINALSTNTNTVKCDQSKSLFDFVPSSASSSSSSSNRSKKNNTKNREDKMSMKLCKKCIIGTGTRQFEFNAYATQTFSELMHLWNISKQQLLNSLQIGDIHQIANPNGRLSSMDIFIKTADKQFFIKDVKTGMETLTNAQRKALNKMKPRSEIDFFRKSQFLEYCTRVKQEAKFYARQSLLPKFFAFFGITDNSYGVAGEERFFVVTKNLFPAIYKNEQSKQQFALNFTYKFDVKGSLDHQKLSFKKRNPPALENGEKIEPTFRYLDLYDEAEERMSAADRTKLEATREGCFFRDGILLADETYQTFIGILERDALFLRNAGKTDYSLLLGITFDQLNEDKMELLKKENPNILVASCFNCSANRGQSYSKRIDNFVIIPGIIDTLAQFNWRKIIDLTNRIVVKHETEKKAKSAINPNDYFYRFMCAISTKVFRPRQNQGNQLGINTNNFCHEIAEPSFL